MKKAIIILSIALLSAIILTACSKEDDEEEETTPVERFDDYVDEWNEQNFDDMYDFLSEEAAGTYSSEDFVDRYEDIYDDSEVEDLQIDYDDLDEETLDEAMSDGEAEIPFSVAMNTVAGSIDFDYQAMLIKEGETEDEDGKWYVDWDPGFIFPELKDGGEISLQSEAPDRGSIYDRNDEPLATNDTVHDIGIVPEQMDDDEEQTKEKIADLLDIDTDTIDAKLDQDWVDSDVRVPIQTIPDATSKLLGNFEEINGVDIIEDQGRVYPEAETTSHLVGHIGQVQEDDLEDMDDDERSAYSDDDVIGKRGLEKFYEDDLRGEKGMKIIVTYDDAEDGEEEPKDDTILAEKSAEDGEDITTTIDMDVQEAIYDSYDDDTGTAAAIDPKSGETLALISSPAFDPNEFAYGVSEDTYKELSDDDDKPLLNKFSQTFAPGSAIKPITAAIGLENDTIDPNEELEIKGKEWSNGEGWGDYTVKRVSGENEHVDLSDAIVESDNIYFAKQAVDMGGDTFVEGLENFGFDEKLPFEYGIKESTASSNGSLDDEVLLANAGYGQGELEMSPLHLALAYTAILNDGDMLQPTLFKNEDTDEVWKEDLLTSDEAEMLRDDLRHVVKSSNGTATKAQEADFPISGKTGTAELKRTDEETSSNQENGWFVGYPSDDEDILIAMMIEDTEEEGGSSYTVEKVSDILQTLKE